ncbi:MAG TPA: hypothetical protein VM143_01365 [Acidimicrobiales bacterium]|nr:hypothetical protein [Acidimicrobiales bacterium]
MRFLVVIAVGLVASGAVACSTSDDATPGDGDSAAGRPRAGEGESVLEGRTRACEPPPPIPPAEVAHLLPQHLTLPPGAVVIGKEDEPTHVTVTGQLDASSGATPASLRERFASELEDAGYEITGGEDEGHESEVFFAFDDGRKGTVQSVISTCPPDTVRIIISYLKPPNSSSEPRSGGRR